ncbi:MAG: hypothetical protein JSV80_18485 [Acidobacteriota bacterium]|nr:MAG: hypothetical protein JSV80_18485 [Acidobacteriota bacterium]
MTQRPRSARAPRRFLAVEPGTYPPPLRAGSVIIDEPDEPASSPVYELSREQLEPGDTAQASLPSDPTDAALDAWLEASRARGDASGAASGTGPAAGAEHERSEVPPAAEPLLGDGTGADAGSAVGRSVPTTQTDQEPGTRPVQAHELLAPERRRARTSWGAMLLGTLLGGLFGVVAGTLLLGFTRMGPEGVNWRDPLSLWTSIADPILALSAALVVAGSVVLGTALGWRRSAAATPFTGSSD